MLFVFFLCAFFSHSFGNCKKTMQERKYLYNFSDRFFAWNEDVVGMWKAHRLACFLACWLAGWLAGWLGGWRWNSGRDYWRLLKSNLLVKHARLVVGCLLNVWWWTSWLRNVNEIIRLNFDKVPSFSLTHCSLTSCNYRFKTFKTWKD